MSHEPPTTSVRAEVGRIATAAVRGDLDILDAATQLSFHLGALGLNRDDPDYETLWIIADETEHLPIGRQRKYWAKDALNRKQPEVDKARKWAIESGAIEACERLKARFEHEGGASDA